ncbi:dynein heavy chain, cytoplasmic-like [Dermacentor silvarum]|uniref:dynein heavy chain, cytoplasmic-like n=1 Tax=Dermacentor silvarum TaxID=543639 RepID=UPI001896ABFD|nr:dynein heavy chain, cytoplasmic-like [Dermacentor silvarum]
MLIEPNAGDSLDKGIASPEGIRRDQFLHWVESLTERQTPSWLGLPNNAEKVLLTNRGGDLIAKLLKMQLLEDDDEPAYVAAEEGERAVPGDGRPAWMATLQQSGSTWLRLLPPSLQSLRRTKDNIGDPLYRCLEREVNVGSKLLKVVRSDLEDMVRICRGERRQTNYHRTMIADLAKGMLPSHWKKYTVSPGCTVIQWVTDFSDRIKQLQRVSQACTSGGAAALKSLHVWLGGLFNPEAYITATRQYVAQANGWSLEELSLEVRVSDVDEKPGPMDEYSFALAGLKLQGAKCVQSRLSLTSTIFTELPLTTIRWVKYQEEDAGQAMVTLPVYLNSSRTELLFTVDLPAADPRESHSFYERGVALLCSTTLG